MRTIRKVLCRVDLSNVISSATNLATQIAKPNAATPK